MSKEKQDLAPEVMAKIKRGQIKMRPKLYFIIGSGAIFVGLMLSILTSVFLLGLIRFSLRSHGPMGEYRWAYLLDSFPWWAAILAILGMVVGIKLLARYDFSYKANFKVLVVIFVGALIAAGFLVDALGINDLFARRGYMNKLYKQEPTNFIKYGNRPTNNCQR